MFICGSKLARIHKVGCHTAALAGCGGRVIEGTNKCWNQFDSNRRVRGGTQRKTKVLCEPLRVYHHINYIFQQPYHTPVATNNTRGHRPHTPLPDPRSALEHPHPVRSARDGRSSVGRAAQVSGEGGRRESDGRNRDRESFNMTTNSGFVLVILPLPS